MNEFFSSIVQKPQIPKFDANDSVTENLKDPVFKLNLKYKNHASILAIQKYRKKKTFYFEEVNTGEIEKQMFMLHITKASQKTDTPTGISKENIDLFPEF